MKYLFFVVLQVSSKGSLNRSKNEGMLRLLVFLGRQKVGFEKGEDFSSSGYEDHDRQIRRKQEELFELLKGISRDARKDQSKKSLMTAIIGHSAFWTITNYRRPWNRPKRRIYTCSTRWPPG